MKFERKQSIKMDFNNCELRVVDGEIFIVEYDKDMNPIDEFNLREELENKEGFLEEPGFKISIVRSVSAE